LSVFVSRGSGVLQRRIVGKILSLFEGYKEAGVALA
jgi:hypothetical protein